MNAFLNETSPELVNASRLACLALHLFGDATERNLDKFQKRVEKLSDGVLTLMKDRETGLNDDGTLFAGIYLNGFALLDAVEIVRKALPPRVFADVEIAVSSEDQFVLLGSVCDLPLKRVAA